MCGICGRVNQHQPVERQLIKAMANVLEHRGPDQEGFHVESNTGLGFRRLSIIDLSTGDQPMTNEDGSIVIIFNGEIYNFQDLRPDLEARGHQFRTRSDTEVIVHAYEEYGTDFVIHLHGMFALAIWDRNRQRLVLARDRMGKKPLFYHHAPGGLLFASELKSILQDPVVPRRVSALALDRYLAYRYTAGQDITILEHVCQLPPAHLLIYKAAEDRLTVQRYWSPLDAIRETPTTDEEIDALFRDAVRVRLISDVPLGAFLSGGIDSSLIVALMASFSDRPVTTFSIGFHEKRYNELPYARQVAERYHTEHYEHIVEPNALDVLPALVWYLDEPFGDSSALPAYYVAQMARQHVTVALSGDGGDESFAGYRHYKSMVRTLRYGQLHPTVRHGLIEPVLEHVPARGPVARLQKMVDYAHQTLPEQHANRVRITHAAQRSALYRSDFAAQLADNSDQYVMDQFVQHPQLSPVGQMLLTDLLTVLPGDFLVKADRMSMGNSLEARSPFLDHRLVEAALNLPDDARLRWYGPSKLVLRRLYSHLLPPDILKRPKAGFAVPLDDWFRGRLAGLARETLLSTRARQRGLFDSTAVEHLIDQHTQGQARRGTLLWTLLMLELWFCRFLDQGNSYP
jgi:asparagine synthase (glutamine-hydrolysing)